MTQRRLFPALAVATWALTVGFFVTTVALAAAYWNVLPAIDRDVGQWAIFPSVLTFATIGTILVIRRPENRIGRIVTFVGFMGAINQFGNVYGAVALHAHVALPGAIWVFWTEQWSWAPEFVLIPAVLPMVFPTGHVISARWRFAVALGLLALLAAIFYSAFIQNPYYLSSNRESFQNPARLPIDLGVEGNLLVVSSLLLLFVVVSLLGLASIVVRWRTAAREERQQLKWFAFSIIVLVLLQAPSLVVQAFVQGSVPDWAWVPGEFAFNLVPIAIAFAILRYRLYDIDLVINRTVVYVGMAAFITAVYVGVVVGAGTLIGSRGGAANLGLSILATALVAVAFEPFLSRMQRFANRVAYGPQVTGYEALAQFSQRLSVAPSIEQVLPTVAEAAGSLLNVAYARATLFLPGAGERSASWGNFADSVHRLNVPLVHEAETLGELHLRSDSPFLGDVTSRVLQDFSNQAGLLLRNVRLTLELESRLDRISVLTEKLRASRQRIVTAADAQRRRLEAEIHQTTETQLQEVAARLHVAEAVVTSDPKEAGHVLDELVLKTNTALDGLRELARGVFPPLLVDKGVPAALQAHVRKLQIPVALRLVDGFDRQRLNPRLEAALYFCCVAVLQEATRLGACSADVELARRDSIATFSIASDMQGQLTEGAIESMNDRVEALGGLLAISSDLEDRETVVEGWIPVPDGEREKPALQPAAASAQAAASLSGPNSDLGR